MDVDPPQKVRSASTCSSESPVEVRIIVLTQRVLISVMKEFTLHLDKHRRICQLRESEIDIFTH